MLDWTAVPFWIAQCGIPLAITTLPRSQHQRRSVFIRKLIKVDLVYVVRFMQLAVEMFPFRGALVNSLDSPKVSFWANAPRRNAVEYIRISVRRTAEWIYNEEAGRNNLPAWAGRWERRKSWRPCRVAMAKCPARSRRSRRLRTWPPQSNRIGTDWSGGGRPAGNAARRTRYRHEWQVMTITWKLCFSKRKEDGPGEYEAEERSRQDHQLLWEGRLRALHRPVQIILYRGKHYYADLLLPSIIWRIQ